MTCLMCELLHAVRVATSHRTLQWSQQIDIRQPLLQPSWRLGESGTQVCLFGLCYGVMGGGVCQSSHCLVTMWLDWPEQ